MNESTKLTSPDFKKKLASLMAHLAKQLGINQLPNLKLINDKKNSNDPFGLTGHYNPENFLITIYITDRHDTDILRSFAHEVIHHWQNLCGTLHSQENQPETEEHYAQNDPHLRKKEMEAYLFGNMLFRDWQDENRYGPVDNLPLNENLSVSNPEGLKLQAEKFVQSLIENGIISSFHRERTSGDMNPQDFSNDISHKIVESITELIQTINNKGNWENQPTMIKEVMNVQNNDEVTCKNCGNKCKYESIPEVKMGSIQCPNCNKLMDQEGNSH